MDRGTLVISWQKDAFINSKKPNAWSFFFSKFSSNSVRSRQTRDGTFNAMGFPVIVSLNLPEDVVAFIDKQTTRASKAAPPG